MNLAADKPIYLPAAGYFFKMARAHLFVIADDLQYTTAGLVHRALIRSASGPLWLSVPVLTGKKGIQQIREVQIDNSKNWRQKHRKALRLNYQYAPYFEYYEDFFEQLYRKEWKFLLDLNLAAIEFLRTATGVRTPLRFSSEFNASAGATEKIIDISRKTGCRGYLALREDEAFLQADLFTEAGIALEWLDFPPPAYPLPGGREMLNVSLLDTLFHHGPETAKRCGFAR